MLASLKRGFLSNSILNPDFAVGIVARRRKPWRNVQLERFCDEGISIDMLRSKIVKQALQQGFSSHSRWLLQILGSNINRRILVRENLYEYLISHW